MNGVLYGTTGQGGQYGYGTVYKITPEGHESGVYSFKGPPDGWAPSGELTEVNGKLYGTTPYGG